MNIDINNLGTFTDIAAVWAAYPEGGNEGDYLFIGDTKYRWNKYNLNWENASVVTESEARKLTELYADVTVNNDLHVGGTLYYHRLKGYDLGLFSTSTALSTAYPSPEVGMWAFVVHPSIEDKYQLYGCTTAGTWTVLVSETTLDILDFENYNTSLALMQQIANGAQLAGYRAAASVNDLPTEDPDPTLGWIVGNHLYVYVGTGGDTLNGKYKNCGELRGAKGEKGDKGDDGVVLDGVTVFDGLDDLEGKSTAQKEAMVPDGNMVSSIASDIDNLTWNKYTVMAGLVENNVVLDARPEILGEANPDYGSTIAYADSNRMATHFLPLMGCDKARIYCQLTSNTEALYDIDGVVAYDESRQPLSTPVHVIEQGSVTYGYVEWVRPANAAYIRYTIPLKSSNSMSQHLPNVELWFNMKNGTLKDNMLNEESITLTTTATDYGRVRTDRWIRLSDGVIQSNSGFGCAYLNIPSGAKYLIVSARILHTQNVNVSNHGSLFLDVTGGGTTKSTNIVEVTNELKNVTNSDVSGGYVKSVCLQVPEGAKSFRWTISDGVSSVTLKVLSTKTDWKKNVISEINEIESNETLEYIHQAKFRSSSSTTHDETVLGLIHYSDWHGDKGGASMILDWADRINAAKTRFGYTVDVVNDILNTGDVVPDDLTGSGAAYYFDTQLPQRSLFVLGNHEQKGGLTGTGHDDAFYFGLTGDGEKSAAQSDDVRRADTVAASHAFSFNTYFVGSDSENPLHAGWGVTMPTGYDDPDSPYYQACYWHKDYTTQKVRLIGVDCMYRFDGILKKDGNGDFVLDANNMLDIATGGDGMAWKTTEQETWLYNLLMDAITNNYSVLIASHAILDSMESKNTLDENGKNTDEHGGRVLNYMTGEVVNFEYSRAATISSSTGSPLPYDAAVNLRNREPYSDTSYGYRTGAANNMGDIVQKFIDSGGKFVAWLCGHTHSNHFFYPGGGPAYYPLYYPDILNVTIERAGNTAGMNSTAHRAAEGPSRIAANYYAIDTTNGLFKIVRLGLTTNRHLRSMKYLCYDYINKKVISEG